MGYPVLSVEGKQASCFVFVFFPDAKPFVCLRMETRECSLSLKRSSVLMEILEVGI